MQNDKIRDTETAPPCVNTWLTKDQCYVGFRYHTLIKNAPQTVLHFHCNKYLQYVL